MDNLDKKLEELKQQLDDLKAEVARREEELTADKETVETKKRALKEVTDTLTALERVEKDTKDAAKAIQARRQEAAQAVQAAEDTLKTLQKRLSEELNPKRLAQTETEDKKLDKERKTVADLKEAIASTEAEVAKAKTDAQVSGAAFSEAQARLRQLAVRMQQTVGQLTARQKAAQDAMDTGRANEAAFLVRDLERVSKTLKELAAPDNEKQLLGELDESWLRSYEVGEIVAQKNDHLQSLKGKLAKAERELQQAEKQRPSSVG
jgi:chromosome segregation ATPase